MIGNLANLDNEHPRLVFGYTSRSSVYTGWKRGCAVATAAKLGRWKSIRLVLDTDAHPENDRAVIDRVYGLKRNKGRKPRA